MILDLDTLAVPSALLCDLCIVGSGAAGLAIASEMLHSRVRTLIVESGGMVQDPPTQALYDVDISGLPHPGSTQGRFRICGGSTTQWGGQALPLMPIDFERRQWIPHSGWPISWDDLAPFYARATNFLLVDNRNFDTDLFAHLRTLPPAFDAQRIWYHFSKWSPKPSLREHCLPALSTSENTTLLLHANVTRILLTKELDRVERLELSSLAGAKAEIRARAFVLCAGGIETARLLLVNNEQHLQGIGNEHDLVGRFFQDHPSAMVGWLKSSQSAQAQKVLNVFHKDRLKYSVRCTAAPELQRQQELLNVSMGTTFVEENPALQDAKDIYSELRHRQISGATARKMLRLASRPAGAILPIWHFLRYGRSFAPGARMRIGLTSEQEPNPESRVLLSDRTDSLGMRRSNVRWKLTERTLLTIRRFAQVLGEEFSRAGIGTIELDDWVLDDSSEWTNQITDQFHHIGTARMNHSPRLGVVNPNCQVHGVRNLYIGSSAVFPTSGHSNPTLTIIALCMRLADWLKSELR